jgi:hypothetical protein
MDSIKSEQGKPLLYYYFEKDSIEGKILRLFLKCNVDVILCRRCQIISDYCSECGIFGDGAFLIFDNQNSRKLFENYVVKNIDLYNSFDIENMASGAKYHADENPHLKWCIETIIKLYQMYTKWKQGGNT